MLSEIWTIEVTDDAGDPVTLSSLGIEDFELTGRSQKGEDLVLQLAVENYGDDELWSYGDSIDLFRDDELFFRGKVRQTPRSADGRGDRMGYVIRNVWDQLERVVYLQSWGSYSAGSVSSVQHARIILGYDADSGAYVDSMTVLGSLVSYAASLGIGITLDTAGVTGISIPAIATLGRTVAELIREVMEWHPDCVIAYGYTASATVLKVRRRSTTSAELLSGEGRPLSACDIHSRPDLVPGNVILSYEAQVTDIADAGSSRLQVYRDTYPDSDVDEDTLYAPIPVQGSTGLTGAEARAIVTAGRPPSHKTHVVPITTRDLPVTGSYDEETEQFWLDYSGLGSLGLTTDDIALPTSSSGPIRPHTVRLNSEDIEGPPETTNPNSTPVWKPAAVTDLPRVLVAGALHDWMGVKGHPVICEVTIGIRAATIEALPEADRENFLRTSGAIPGNVSGFAAYLCNAQLEVLGTDAAKERYEKSISVDLGAEQTTEDPETGDPVYNENASDQIVPNLARRLYEARQELPYEGTWTLAERDAGATRYLGKVINVYHPDRSEWGTMRGLVQMEKLTGSSGKTTITFGPPGHLGPQDFLALLRGARLVAMERNEQASAPVDQTGGTFTAAYEGKGNPVVDGALTPIRNFSWRSIRKPRARKWSVTLDEGSTTSLQWLPVVGKLWQSDDEVTVNGAGTALSISDGDWLFLKLEGGLPSGTIGSSDVSIKKDSSKPDEYKATGTAPNEVMDEYRKVLCSFHDSDPGGDSDQLAADLWVRYLTADSDLQVTNQLVPWDNSPGVLSAVRFMPE